MSLNIMRSTYVVTGPRTVEAKNLLQSDRTTDLSGVMVLPAKCFPQASWQEVGLRGLMRFASESPNRRGIMAKKHFMMPEDEIGS